MLKNQTVNSNLFLRVEINSYPVCQSSNLPAIRVVVDPDSCGEEEQRHPGISAVSVVGMSLSPLVFLRR